MSRPTADERQGARPPAVRRATLWEGMVCLGHSGCQRGRPKAIPEGSLALRRPADVPVGLTLTTEYRREYAARPLGIPGFVGGCYRQTRTHFAGKARNLLNADHQPAHPPGPRGRPLQDGVPRPQVAARRSVASAFASTRRRRRSRTRRSARSAAFA